MSMSSVPQSRHILTPTKLNRLAKTLLQTEIGLIWLQGEISNFVAASSGHWYFTLKDNRAQIRGAMFKQANHRVATRPKEGDKVLIRASVGLYEPRGDYQLIVEHLELDGEGALKRELEILKQQLNREGLFDTAKKRPLPTATSKLGVITSASGAALQDVLAVLKRRAPDIEVIVYPTLVQGEQAPEAIRQALQIANERAEVDVLLITRGGGSLEDLWAFNNAELARDIAQSTLITVSAVGHEVDVTISDLVADLRAPTPSAAAELISPNARERAQRIVQLSARLNHAIDHVLEKKQAQREGLNKSLNVMHPSRQLLQHAQHLDKVTAQLKQNIQVYFSKKHNQYEKLHHRLMQMSPEAKIQLNSIKQDNLNRRLTTAWEALYKHKLEQLQRQAGYLNALSPLATLSRGYSITLQADRAVTKAKDLDLSEPMITKFQDGEVVSMPLANQQELDT